MALNNKQERFCEEYLKDLNATQAAIRAGYSKRTSYAIGHENLNKPEIEQRIQQLKKERSDRTKITADMIVKELALIAFANMKDFVFVKDGEMSIDFEEIEEEKKAVISEVSAGNGNVLKIKLHNKLDALEKLAKHIDFYKADSTKSEGVNVIIYLPHNDRD